MSMPFTGERYVPEVRGQIYYEHLHRYSLALRLARGADVLDIASGEGYGAAYLSMVARSVVGVDIDPQSVRHAASRYTEMNLSFRVGSCTHIPLADASVDLVVSFETIEHLSEQDQFVREILRVLRPDGRLLMSSPNKLVYSDLPHYENPYHIRELYFDEFRDLLQASFAHCRLYGQRVIGASAIHPLRGLARDARCIGPTSSEDAWGLPALPEPTYFIAVCARSGSIEDLEQLDSIFIDPRDDLMQHFVGGSPLSVTAGGLENERYLEPQPVAPAFPPSATRQDAPGADTEIAAAFEAERNRWDAERTNDRDLMRGLLRSLLGDDVATFSPLHEAIGRGHDTLADLLATRARLSERNVELEASIVTERGRADVLQRRADDLHLQADELQQRADEPQRRADDLQAQNEQAAQALRRTDEILRDERVALIRRLKLDTDEIQRLEDRVASLDAEAKSAESRAAVATRHAEELTIALRHATGQTGTPEGFVTERTTGRDAVRVELTAMAAQLDAIVNSRSWRMTKPLRIAVRALRRK